jgi:hypothetical protein
MPVARAGRKPLGTGSDGMRFQTYRRAAIAAICVTAGTLLSAQTAQAACGTRALGSGRSSKCSNIWDSGSKRDSATQDYNLGTVRGSNRGGRDTTNPDLGSVRRSPGWDRRRSLGRGSYRPR